MRLFQALNFLLFFSFSFSLEQNFERAEFPSRSADIIVLPNNIQDDSFLFLLNSNNVELPREGLQIEETNIANMISSLVGGPIVNAEGSLDENVSPYVGNLFNKEKANFVVFINSVGSSDLASFPSLKFLEQRGQRLAIKRVAYPQDTIASLTTLMTGHTPSTHGIVNKMWESLEGVKNAYGAEGQMKIFNLNDQFSQTFEGQPLIISASINYQMTCALGVNPKSTFGNNFAFYWDEEIQSFVNLNNGPAYGLTLNVSELLKNFEDNEKITSVFDLKSVDDFSFLSEIAFLKNLVKAVSKNDYLKSLVSDKVPDLFAYSFASLNALKLGNGVDSPKFSAVMALVDETLLEVFNAVSTLYSGKVSFEVVFMGTPAYEKLAEDQQLKNRLLSLLKNNVNKQTFDTYFPSIYLQGTSNQISMCQRVREAIPNEVICTNHKTRVPTVAEIASAAGQNVSDTYNENATTFQTVLWMSIIMTLFVIGAVSALYYVDLGQDSILSRTTLKQHNL